jgi:hypothetical protein
MYVQLAMAGVDYVPTVRARDARLAEAKKETLVKPPTIHSYHQLQQRLRCCRWLIEPTLPAAAAVVVINNGYC